MTGWLAPAPEPSLATLTMAGSGPWARYQLELPGGRHGLALVVQQHERPVKVWKVVARVSALGLSQQAHRLGDNTCLGIDSSPLP